MNEAQLAEMDFDERVAYLSRRRRRVVVESSAANAVLLARRAAKAQPEPDTKEPTE